MVLLAGFEIQIIESVEGCRILATWLNTLERTHYALHIHMFYIKYIHQEHRFTVADQHKFEYQNCLRK